MLTHAVASWVRVASSSCSCIFFSSFLTITTVDSVTFWRRLSFKKKKKKTCILVWKVSSYKCRLTKEQPDLYIMFLTHLNRKSTGKLHYLLCAFPHTLPGQHDPGLGGSEWSWPCLKKKKKQYKFHHWVDHFQVFPLQESIINYLLEEYGHKKHCKVQILIKYFEVNWWIRPT